jgi:hypothetical protein
MVSYCKEEHLKIDYLNHKGLCMAIKLIAKRRGKLPHFEPISVTINLNVRVLIRWACVQYGRTFERFGV